MRRSDNSRRPRRPDYGLSVERPRFEKEPLAERLVFGEGTFILRATGTDLTAYRAGRISREDAIKRIEVRVF